MLAELVKLTQLRLRLAAREAAARHLPQGGSEATPLGSCFAFATSICAATSPDAETRRKDAPLGFFDDLVLDTDQCYLFTLEPGVPDLDVTRLPKPLANLFRRHAHT